MIKLEHVVLASPEQMEFIIEGMRNPMNSWNKTDSFNGCETYKGISKCLDCDGIRECGAVNKYLIVGENDHSLMQRLSKAGTDHRKFMRMLPVYVRITINVTAAVSGNSKSIFGNNSISDWVNRPEMYDGDFSTYN